MINEGVTREMLVEDWNITQSEIDAEVSRHESRKENDHLYAAFCAGTETIAEKEFHAVRRIANARIEDLNESIGKELKILIVLHYVIPSALIALYTFITLCFVGVTVKIIPTYIVLLVVFMLIGVGVSAGFYVTTVYDKAMYSILKKKYPWWYRGGGGLYFDNIGQYYDIEMPAT